LWVLVLSFKDDEGGGEERCGWDTFHLQTLKSGNHCWGRSIFYRRWEGVLQTRAEKRRKESKKEVRGEGTWRNKCKLL